MKIAYIKKQHTCRRFQRQEGEGTLEDYKEDCGGKETARVEAAGGRGDQTGVSSHGWVPEHTGLSSYTAPQRNSTDED